MLGVWRAAGFAAGEEFTAAVQGAYTVNFWRHGNLRRDDCVQYAASSCRIPTAHCDAEFHGSVSSIVFIRTQTLLVATTDGKLWLSQAVMSTPPQCLIDLCAECGLDPKTGESVIDMTLLSHSSVACLTNRGKLVVLHEASPLEDDLSARDEPPGEECNSPCWVLRELPRETQQDSKFSALARIGNGTVALFEQDKSFEIWKPDSRPQQPTHLARNIMPSES